MNSDEQPTLITFVRHGQSLSNVVRRWEGHGDSALSELGEQQASLLCSRLRARRFTHVISSDLKRAVDTVRGTGLPFETSAALREIDVGAWHGLTTAEVNERFPEEIAALNAGQDVARGGGESYAAFSARVQSALDALRARLVPGDHALVACHGGFIGAAVAHALGLGAPLEWPLGHAANTSVTELSYTSAGVQLHVFNDTLHLQPLGEWPRYPDTSGVVGLVCDALEGDWFGAFVAHYDATEHVTRLGPTPSREARAQSLRARLEELQALHPTDRVALAARAACIQAWTEQALWRGARGTGYVAAPLAGSLSHVARWGERLVLLDYGLRALAPAPSREENTSPLGA